MTVTIGVFTGLIAILAFMLSMGERNSADTHRWGPWFAVAAGLIAMAVAS